MYYTAENSKGFEQAASDLEAAVKSHGLGVMHIHDLPTTIIRKGVHVEEECRLFEIRKAQQAAKLLAGDMRLNLALSCRISVHTEKGRTWIGLIKPARMLAALMAIAGAVESATMKMVDEAR